MKLEEGLDVQEGNLGERQSHAFPGHELHNHNNERPHRGYRNQGRKPYETFTKAKKEVEKHRAKRKDKGVRKEAA